MRAIGRTQDLRRERRPARQVHVQRMIFLRIGFEQQMALAANAGNVPIDVELRFRIEPGALDDKQQLPADESPRVIKLLS